MGHGLFESLPFALERHILALVALATAVGSVVGKTARRDQLHLASVIAAGIGLRLLYSQDTLMDMSNYWRAPAILDWLHGAGVPVYALFADGMDRFEVFSRLHLVFSCALPLLVYCLADELFGRRRVSLCAAFLTAICPLQIHFAASESMYISSNFLTTGAFLLLHRAFAERHRGMQFVYGLGAIQLYEVAVRSREANILFGALAAVAALWLLAAPGRRASLKALWALPLLVLSAEHALERTTGLSRQGDAASLSLAQHLDVVWKTFPPDTIASNLLANNYLRPSLYPIGITLLALLGIVRLARNERRHLFYVLSFFSIFYVGHATVVGWDQLAISRYGLQSVLPIALAAGFGLDYMLQLRSRLDNEAPALRFAAISGVALLLLSTIPPALTIHRAPPSDIQEEYAFLRELRARDLPPPSSLVIEPDVADVGALSAGIGKGPRFAYFGRRVRGGDLEDAVSWSRTLPSTGDGTVYLYVGLPCYFMHPPGQAIAPACAEFLETGEWEVIASRRIDGRRHDTSNGHAATGNTIALYRRRPEG